MIISNKRTGKYCLQIERVDQQLLDAMVSYKSECLRVANKCNSSFDDIVGDVIDRTEIKDRKFRTSTLGKAKFDKLRKELDEEGNWKYKGKWEWDNGQKKYVNRYPVLGEYIPKDRKVILYVKNIEDVCASDGVPFYCGVLAVFIHELFHAVHHVVANNGQLPYDTIREIEEAMTEFSTLVFLKELINSYKLGDNMRGNWDDVCDWAKKSIERKQRCLGDLPAYGFGYYLFDTLYWQASNDNAYKWIERYNQKVGAIDNKNRYVKWYQQMLNPEYPSKDEKLCLELFHSVLFNL